VWPAQAHRKALRMRHARCLSEGSPTSGLPPPHAGFLRGSCGHPPGRVTGVRIPHGACCIRSYSTLAFSKGQKAAQTPDHALLQRQRLAPLPCVCHGAGHWICCEVRVVMRSEASGIVGGGRRLASGEREAGVRTGHRPIRARNSWATVAPRREDLVLEPLWPLLREGAAEDPAEHGIALAVRGCRGDHRRLADQGGRDEPVAERADQDSFRRVTHN